MSIDRTPMEKKPRANAANTRNMIRLSMSDGPSTMWELCEDVGGCKSNIQKHLKKMKELGHVVPCEDGTHGYQLTTQSVMEPWEGTTAVRRWVVKSDAWFSLAEAAEMANTSETAAWKAVRAMFSEGLVRRRQDLRKSNGAEYAKVSVAARDMVAA